MVAKSLIKSSRVTVGKNTYIAGKRVVNYKLSPGTSKPQKAFLIKKKTVNYIREKRREILTQKNPILKNKHSDPKGFIKNTARSTIKNLKNTIDNTEDRTVGVINTAINSGEVSLKIFKASQTTTAAIIKASKGTYTVGKTTIKAVGVIDKKIGMIKLGHLKLDVIAMNEFRKFALDKTKQIKTVKNILQKIKSVKAKVKAIKQRVQNTKKVIKKAELYTGMVLTGVVKVKINKETLIKAALLSGKAASLVIKDISNAKNVVKKIADKTKVLTKPLSGTGDALENTLNTSDDTGVQSLGVAVKTARNAPGVIKTATKITNKTAKAQIKTIKTTIKGVKTIKKYGFKGASKKLGNKVVKAFRNAGKSIVSALAELVKKAFLKFLLPIILIVVVVIILMNAMSAPLNVISSMFSGIISFFSGDGSDESQTEEVKITDYVNETIDDKTAALTESIKNTAYINLVENGGNYHGIRLIYDETIFELNNSSDLSGILPLETFADITEPIFNSLLLERYEFSPSENQAEEVISEIWSQLVSTVTANLPTEYCSDLHYCGIIHANSSCVNYETGRHSESTCNNCDSYIYSCDGHLGSHSYPACYALRCAAVHTHISSCFILSCPDSHTFYHNAAEQIITEENKRVLCNGFRECSGHLILGIEINTASKNDILNEYFLNRITELELIETRTEEEKEELSVLKDNYEWCLSFFEVLEE